MKSLFEKEPFQEVKDRMSKLNENLTPQWGKMSVDQMLKHCQFPLEVALNKMQLEKPGFLKKALFSMFKSSLYNDKLWRKGIPTPKEFKVIDNQDFNEEYKILSQLIEEFHHDSDNTNRPEHPMFGEFTQEQWGKMQYKHLDHHFRQFGV